MFCRFLRRATPVPHPPPPFRLAAKKKQRNIIKLPIGAVILDKLKHEIDKVIRKSLAGVKKVDDDDSSNDQTTTSNGNGETSDISTF